MKGNELKPHIGLFGRRNQGKSSFINFITGQEIAIVSAEAGTTTDPVRKTMEIKGIGPVVWIDTAGIDDVGDLGNLRTQKTLQVLTQVDLALILFSENNFSDYERTLIDVCNKHNINYILIYSKCDAFPIQQNILSAIEKKYNKTIYQVSNFNAELRDTMLNVIRENIPETAYVSTSLLGDIISANQKILLVTPIDSSAPEGRLILPQVQVIRDILDNNAVAIVCKETELEHQLKSMPEPPSLVVTDSQVFKYVSEIVPSSVPLTSFSIVLARQKGPFNSYLLGTPTLATIEDGDTIAMLESCTHKATCEDIGRVKLPNLIRKFTCKTPKFDFIGGLTELTHPITDYKMVIQCGGCVLSKKQLESRLQPALDTNIPVSNYGMAIAFMTGIFNRATEIFRK